MKNPTIVCYFSIPISTRKFVHPHRYPARYVTSAQLFLPRLLHATKHLHTASSSSSTFLELHTYLLHLAL